MVDAWVTQSLQLLLLVSSMTCFAAAYGGNNSAVSMLSISSAGINIIAANRSAEVRWQPLGTGPVCGTLVWT